VDALLGAQRRYRAGITRLFAAVDARQQSRVVSIDTGNDPVFSAIEARVDQAARADGAVAAAKLQLLRTSERRVLAGTAIVIGVGLLLLGLFALILVRVNRQLRRQAVANEHNALHDDLTGLPNRRLLVDRLAQLVAAASRDPEPFSLLMIDLDRFKEINDTLGHPTGDLLLQAVAPRLAPLLRPADTLARIGGDEFAILLPSASTAAARTIAERALAALGAPLALPDFVATIDSSIGIVSFPTHGDDAETLMQRVDVAVDLAKTQQSGNAVYDHDHDPFDPERLSLSADLREAIAHRSIEVHYQPKFDAQTLRPAGVEALARWSHPLKGMIGPCEFIPLAEHTGLIKPLTELVLRQAVRQCRLWDEGGHDLPVAVNLSAVNLLDIELVATVRRILEEEGVAPARLHLEITEGTIMIDPERARHVLLELSQMGIGLSVDDFGTGYSSLAYLRRLPVQELKVDRSFITHLASDSEDAALVRATIQLGHSLGLTIVAEGVEDAASLQRLRELQCDTIQGFHLCRPLPPETLIATLDGLASRTPRQLAFAAT
jgi:diguanylate cyclase (GGDEF)-like protein